MIRKVLAIFAPLAFLAFVWWGAWFLRGGPTSPHDWAFGPIVITGLALIIASVVAFVFRDGGDLP